VDKIVLGKTSIAIPAILKVEKGVLKHIGQVLREAELTKVVILFGNGLIDMFGGDVMNSLKEEGIEVLQYQELDTVELSDITDLAFSMPNKTMAIVGIGGGKVIDAAK
jgi:glycerol-1-phosphate dehydrogenase [NAD(P)+]